MERSKNQLHNGIVLKYNIPDELLLNIDQTSSKCVPTEDVAMAETGSKHISRKGRNDKQGITVTLLKTIPGKILTFQSIYTRKLNAHFHLLYSPMDFV